MEVRKRMDRSGNPRTIKALRFYNPFPEFATMGLPHQLIIGTSANREGLAGSNAFLPVTTTP
ncbi:MAG: hypothetical protein H6980_06130 [Gammaproteobacteria bacterium]|nr:hypothetical protein [Gammaproteobacteria bacterium]